MMTRPNIQIDDEVREMTDEEYALYLKETTGALKMLHEAEE